MTPPSISPRELAALLAEGPELTVIDVRTPAEFGALHASPARNLPLAELSVPALAALGHTDPGQAIYVLCQSGDRAVAACRELSKGGFGGARVVAGGTAAWLAAGLPVERGTPRGIGLERQVRIAAGVLIVLGVGLAQLVHPGFVWIAGLVGAGLVFAGVTGACGMGVLLAKAPWNRR